MNKNLMLYILLEFVLYSAMMIGNDWPHTKTSQCWLAHDLNLVSLLFYNSDQSLFPFLNS